jgi:hypothetical protein
MNEEKNKVINELKLIENGIDLITGIMDLTREDCLNMEVKEFFDLANAISKRILG